MNNDRFLLLGLFIGLFVGMITMSIIKNEQRKDIVNKISICEEAMKESELQINKSLAMNEECRGIVDSIVYVIDPQPVFIEADNTKEKVSE